MAASAILGTTVAGNTLAFVHNVNRGNCPHVDYAADLSGGHAPGTFQPAPLDANLDGCL